MVGIDIKRKRKSIEHAEQVKLVQRVRAFHPDVLIAAIPNGGDRSASERVRLHGEGVLAGLGLDRDPCATVVVRCHVALLQQRAVQK